MGALNDGVTERCGRVRGVIHEMWIVDKSEHPGVEDLKVVAGHGLQVGGSGTVTARRAVTALGQGPCVDGPNGSPVFFLFSIFPTKGLSRFSRVETFYSSTGSMIQRHSSS